MKKIKSGITLFAICLLLLLAACGGNNATNSSTTDKNESASNSKEKGSDYPKKPVTLMLSFSAGGSTDLFTRQLAEIAEEHLGQKIIIKNETGGGGLTMYSTLMKAKPDGYTMAMGMGTTLYAINPHLKLMDFSGDDFTLVAPILGYQYVIAASKDAPFQTFEELIEYSKTNKVTVASSAITNSLFAELINKAEDFKLNWEIVNFKGAGESTAALLGGHVDISLDPPITMLGPWESGDLNLLATLNEERSAALPDVPTLKELGYENLVLNAVAGIGGPAGLPEDVVAKWEEVIQKTAEDPRLKEFADKNSFTILKMSQKEVMDYLAGMTDEFGSVVDRVTKQ